RRVAGGDDARSLAGDVGAEPADEGAELLAHEVGELVEPDEVVRAPLVLHPVADPLHGAELDRAQRGPAGARVARAESLLVPVVVFVAADDLGEAVFEL